VAGGGEPESRGRRGCYQPGCPFGNDKTPGGTRNYIQSRLSRNGVFLFVLEGQVEVGGQKLERRDGLGISATEQFTIKAETAAELLAIEVPMFA